ncbi:uncharacterized protein LOC112086570 [Eutrema salsugineum]|uniref:uncharacterized protein LOC112086570 n=1 Tax=Eutrema salsugineum TaxID=72664 RepID=UPI000CECF2E5|nr:uncharacterized protein LOC112086570 [Eutrema salsugineum]
MGDFNEILETEEHSNFENSPNISMGMRDFQEVVRHCSLSDMGGHGPLFTWCNKREEGLICKKLDRVLVNDIWLYHHSQAYCVFESGGCSDHLRCRIQMGSQGTRKKRPFKFINSVGGMAEFAPLVAEHWSKTEALFHSTSALYRFSKKLKTLKPGIRDLSKRKFGNLALRSKLAFQALCEKQGATLINPTPDRIREDAEAFERWQRVATLEEEFYKQKAKLHWLEVGDQNTKVFHNAVKVREARNGIREILCSNGDIVKTQGEIKEEAECFFHEFLTHKTVDLEEPSIHKLEELLDFRCTAEDSNLLVKEVTEKEITKVLFSMPSNKSPGPDGYTSELKGMMSRLIDPNQTAFVENRLLMESILLATELVKDYHKVSISGRSALQIDISKAFDSLQWPFILNALKAMQFPPQFIHWIRLCITSASFSVQVNGELAGFCRSERGLRQGCALSPYLFVMSMNVLTKMLDAAAKRREIGYHPRCQNLSLTHLCFADDVMVFTDGKQRSIDGVLKVFRQFARLSGLQISVEKSTIYMAGISQTEREAILANFPFASGQLPVRYLGLPLLTKCMTVGDYKPLIEKQSLWKKWVFLYLIRKDTFWSVGDKQNAGSWMWRKILKLRPLARDFHRVEVKSGSNTSFWYDHWSSQGRLIESLGVRGCIDLGIPLESTLEDAFLTHRRRRHRHTLLNRVEDEIENAKTNAAAGVEDVAKWMCRPGVYKDRFKSKETWMIIREHHLRCDWSDTVWFKYATPKYSFLLWTAMHDRLATGDRIRDHSIDKTSLFILRYVFQATIYGLWRERNARRHGENLSPPQRLIKVIDKTIRNRLSSIRSKGVKDYENRLVHWFGTRL